MDRDDVAWRKKVVTVDRLTSCFDIREEISYSPLIIHVEISSREALSFSFPLDSFHRLYIDSKDSSSDISVYLFFSSPPIVSTACPPMNSTASAQGPDLLFSFSKQFRNIFEMQEIIFHCY